MMTWIETLRAPQGKLQPQLVKRPWHEKVSNWLIESGDFLWLIDSQWLDYRFLKHHFRAADRSPSPLVNRGVFTLKHSQLQIHANRKPQTTATNSGEVLLFQMITYCGKSRSCDSDFSTLSSRKSIAKVYVRFGEKFLVFLHHRRATELRP